MPKIEPALTDMQRLDLAWLNVIDMEAREKWSPAYKHPRHLREKAWNELHALRGELGLIPGGKNDNPA